MVKYQLSFHEWMCVFIALLLFVKFIKIEKKNKKKRFFKVKILL